MPLLLCAFLFFSVSALHLFPSLSFGGGMLCCLLFVDIFAGPTASVFRRNSRFESAEVSRPAMMLAFPRVSPKEEIC